jgi:hypothetical protein
VCDGARTLKGEIKVLSSYNNQITYTLRVSKTRYRDLPRLSQHNQDHERALAIFWYARHTTYNQFWP